MNTLIKRSALLFSFFCTTQLYAQFGSASLPDYTTSTEKLKKFIKDSIDEHQKTVVNWGTPHKYCLPHVCANRKGKYALVGFDHLPITDFEFDDITGNWHDHVYTVKKGTLSGCIALTGEIIVPIDYPQIFLSNPGNLINTGNKGLVFDRKGKALLPDGYKYLGTLNIGHKTVIKAKQAFDDFITIFDIDGKKITNCNGFNIESVNFVNNNRYLVEVSSDFFTQKKVVDSNLIEIIPPVFRAVIWAGNMWAFGRQASPGNAGLYSLTEKKYYPLPYETIYEPLKDQSGFIVGTASNQLGIIDKKLKEVLPCQYASIEQLPNKDLFIIRTFSNHAGLVDSQGNIVLDTMYANIWPVVIPEPIDREHIRSNPDDMPGSKPLSTEFIRLADHEGNDLIYQLDKKVFLNGYINIVTPDLYFQRFADRGDRLMHRNGKIISQIGNYWSTPTLKVVVQRDAKSTQVQIYDRSGNLLKELENMPKSVDIPYREFYTWPSSDGKVGILDANFNTIVNPQYDAIYTLKEIPQKYMSIWVKYAFQHLEHSFLGWVWNTDKTIPLLIKENGEVINIVELK